MITPERAEFGGKCCLFHRPLLDLRALTTRLECFRTMPASGGPYAPHMIGSQKRTGEVINRDVDPSGHAEAVSPLRFLIYEDRLRGRDSSDGTSVSVDLFKLYLAAASSGL